MVSILDKVIDTIRKSLNKADSKKNLQEKFGFTEPQSEAITELKLYRLSSTDITALIEENKDLKKRIEELRFILSNEKALLKVIKNELSEAALTLGSDRKSEIEDEVEQIKVDHTELISDEKVVVGVTKDGYIKRSNLKSYSGSKACGLKIDDCLLFENEVSTLDTLLLFTNLGNYIYLPVYKIEDQKWKDMGIYISNITSIKKDERIIKTIVISDFKSEQTLLLSTKHGMMKQTTLNEFEISRYTKSVRAMKLSAADELVSVDIGPFANILALSRGGYALRFKTVDLPIYGTQAGGVKCVSLSSGDEVADAIYVNPVDEFVMLTNRGHVIKDLTSELAVYSRNRRGMLIVEKQKNNPHLVVSIAKLTRNQTKENVPVLLAATKYSFKTDVNELKYSNNKFGKKVISVEEYGDAIYIDISPSKNDKFDASLNSEIPNETPKARVKVVEEKEQKVVLEDGMTSDKKKIRISRLDLFDE